MGNAESTGWAVVDDRIHPSSDLEHSVLISRLDLSRRLLDIAAESQLSAHGLQHALGAQELALRILVLALLAMLALDGQHAVLHANVKIRLIKAGS